MRSSYVFTSESVSEGHPDKVCDRISDEVVDLFFREGPKHGFAAKDLRVACETLATTNRVVIAGETRGPREITPDAVIAAARSAIRDIGYHQEGFHWDTCKIEVLLHAQSPHIAQGVDATGNKDEGAGDQGIMFGYACRETESLMPAPLHFSHTILRLMAEARKSGQEPKLGPDAKSQVTVRYEGGKPRDVTQIVVSTQHLDETMNSSDVRAVIEPYVVKALPQGWITPKTVWHVNPTGAFVVGGPDGDTGLTGRKIIVDTYGGAAPHGGGAFSGKDPDQGRPLGRLCRALPRQERRRRRPCRPLHHPDLLRHRRLRSPLVLCRLPRHRPRRRGEARRDAPRADAPFPARHPRAPRPQSADLRANLRLRTFRPDADGRRRLLVGKDGPRAGAQDRLRRLESVATPSIRHGRPVVAAIHPSACAGGLIWCSDSRGHDVQLVPRIALCALPFLLPSSVRENSSH